jgi:tRNA dimethylallyltransferase
MIDVADPEEAYSAGRYAREAETVIDSIFAKSGFPILCGGTGLYLKALNLETGIDEQGL